MRADIAALPSRPATAGGPAARSAAKTSTATTAVDPVFVDTNVLVAA